MPTDTSTLALSTALPEPGAGTPKRHHLDRRADDLVVKGAGNPDDLLNTRQVAEWLGVSTQFLEIARHRGFGPRFVRLSPRRCRYLRSSVLAWLTERTHQATAEYARHPSEEAADA